jgi:hypothetical protein
MKDEAKRLEMGTTKVFLGTILGDVGILKQGLDERGNAHAALDPYIASEVLLLGKPYVDYPLCPPIHMAFNYGMKNHLNVAAYLMNLGVDVNDYRLPASPKKHFERGYPPAMLYALGLGQQPNNSHGAFLQRFYRSYHDQLNYTKLEEWRIATDNPPLLHLSITLHKFDGTYILLSEFTKISSVHTFDQFQMSALHYSVWYANLQATIFLLYNGINLMAKDKYDNTALHLAVIRKEVECATLIFAELLNRAQDNPKRIFIDLLQSKDYKNRDIIDLLMLAPTSIQML